VGGVTSQEGRLNQWMLPNSEIYYAERYGLGESFKYFVPSPGDGKYTLILKFSEVYF
jgi:hypothetical protein